MSYSQFSLASALNTFGLTLKEQPFLPDIPPVQPSELLTAYLNETIPVVSITGSEKARSEGIIYPVLTEVRRCLNRRVSIFSGEEFTVDSGAGLNGVCDFIISRSPTQLLIQAPVVMMAEAKKADLSQGLGQCAAEMVAAQRFNDAAQAAITTIYGCVTSGTQWLFLQLQGQTLTVDPAEYALPPAAPVLGCLIWMVEQG